MLVYTVLRDPTDGHPQVLGVATSMKEAQGIAEDWRDPTEEPLSWETFGDNCGASDRLDTYWFVQGWTIGPEESRDGETVDAADN